MPVEIRGIQKNIISKRQNCKNKKKCSDGRWRWRQAMMYTSEIININARYLARMCLFPIFPIVNTRADARNLATRGRQSPTKQLRREARTTVLIWSSPSTGGGGREQNNKTCTSWIIHVFTRHSNFALVSVSHVNTVSQLNCSNPDEQFSESRSATHS